MSIHHDDRGLASQNIALAKNILQFCRQLSPVIKKLKDDNENGILNCITKKADELWSTNEIYLKVKNLSDLDLANDSWSLGNDMMDAIERLHPTIKAMRDPIKMQSVLDIARGANRILILNKAYAEKKEVGINEIADEIVARRYGD